jgi:hypothetical protein
MKDTNNIQIKCPKEDITYKNPESMYDTVGKCAYAYVTLLMLGDSYVSAAIVMAQSLINAGSQAERIVMITPDITEEAKIILKRFFTSVININYISVTHFSTGDKNKDKYLDLIFTKFNCLNLVQYKKILFINPDSIILTHPDHLFTLQTPAGCATPTVDQYMKNCSKFYHGEKIPSALLKEGLTINGRLLLLKPTLGEFDDILHDISTSYYKNLIETKFTHPDESYISLRYAKNFFQINPAFLGIESTNQEHYSISFKGVKPFIYDEDKMASYIGIESFVMWHDIYMRILNLNPEYANLNVLKDSNKCASYFLKNRKISRETNLNLNIDVFSMSSPYTQYDLPNLKRTYSFTNINSYQSTYYHRDRFITYSSQNPVPMFQNIAKYDYLMPIRKLSESYGKESFYEEIIQNITLSELKPLYKYNYFETETRDLIMLEYIKCRPNMFIIGVWSGSFELEKIQSYITFLESKGNVPYYKTFSLDKKGFQNLMLWTMDKYTFNERLKQISVLMEKFNCKEKNNQVTFIFFDNDSNIDLISNTSIERRNFQNKLLSLLDLDETFSKIFYLNEYFYQTIELSQIILNTNSIKYLSESNPQIFANAFYSDSNLKLQTYRSAIYNNLSLLEMGRLISYGSIILYAYGLRNFTDINSLLISVSKDDTQYEAYLESVIYDNFVNPHTKIQFVNISKENSTNAKPNLNILFKKLLTVLKSNNMINFITNPQNYFYFQGLKLFTFEAEIYRKALSINILNTPYIKEYMDFYMIYLLNQPLINSIVTVENKKDMIKFKFNSVLNTVLSSIKVESNFIDQIKKKSDKLYSKTDLKIIIKI